MTALCLRVWVCAVTLAVARASSEQDLLTLYGARVDLMVEQAQQAARLRNAGDIGGSHNAIKKVKESFKIASNIFPDRPEAYLNMATFYLNTHQFAEATDMWESAKARVKYPKSPQGQNMIERIQSQLAFTKFGQVSVERDKVYREGKGDLHLSKLLIQKQIDIFDAPRMRYDLGTVQLMLSEINATEWQEGVWNFERGQHIALRSAVAFDRALAAAEKRQKKAKCPRSYRVFSVEELAGMSVGASVQQIHILKRLVRSAENDAKYPAYEQIFQRAHSDVRPEDPADGFIAMIRDASLSGPNGVITRKGKCRLDVIGTSSWPYLALHGDFWLSETWRSNSTLLVYDQSLSRRYQPPSPGSIKRGRTVIRKAATIVDFATTNFYHFLLVALPKLLALKDFIASEQLKIIVPMDKSRLRFIERLVSLVIGKPVDDLELVRYDNSADSAPGERFYIKELYFAEARRVVFKAGQQSTHCLMNPVFLRPAGFYFQDNLPSHVKHFEINPIEDGIDLSHPVDAPNAGQYVIYASRSGEKSRRLSVSLETRLLTNISKVSKVVEFHGSSLIMEKAIVLFSGASVVMGVHGAALSNILFCKPKTLVVELGFETPISMHFEHAAKALGLRYAKFVLNGTNEHAMTTETVVLEKEVERKVVELVHERMAERRLGEL